MKPPSFKKPSFKKPNFAPKRAPLPSMTKAPDPLKGVKLPDDVEESPAVELNAVQQGFRDRAAQEAQRFEDATDTGFYTCIVAENRAQLDAFLEAVGMKDKGDLFLDIRDLADALGLDIPKGGARGGSAAKVDPKFEKMVR
jgi:hypothetical protein